MGSYGSEYVVGKEYRNSRATDENEYRGWLNAPLEGGINGVRGIDQLKNHQTGECEFLVFYSSDQASQSHDPWEDVINLEDGVARYWGDSKSGDGPDPLSRRGNRLVYSQYCETYAQKNRSEAPPVLLFQKKRPGYVRFCGLCIISDLSIERHRDGTEIVVNYRTDLEILDADIIELEWIHRKTRTGYDVGGPDAWETWVDSGTVQQYSIYNRRVRSKNDQIATGRFERIHEDIRNRLQGTKKQRGEKLELLLERALNSLNNFQKVNQTPSTGDKGVDLTGEVNLMSDVTVAGPDTEISFKAQVKNKQGSVGGRELSRLASRVDDGEIGLFFTMSHYTNSAQKESLSTYPLQLFSGRDIVELLAQTELVDGDKLNDTVVKEINNAV